MTRSDWLNNRLECTHCGNRYLPPWREGDFRCGVCGTRLPTRSRFTAVRKTAWGLVVPATLLGVALVMVGARSAQRTSSSTPALTVPRPVLPPQWDPEVRVRQARAQQASNLRQLRQHPEASAPHVALAQESYARARAAAEQEIEPPPDNFGMGPGPSPERRRWSLKRDRYVAEHMQGLVAPGLQHAEQAVRLAKNAEEEFDARRARADGWFYSGEYQRAKAEYGWMEAIEPGSAIRSYGRCFYFLGEQVPDSVREVQALFGGPFADPFSSRSLSPELLQASIKANEEWRKRRPKDPVIDMRLGSLCYRLAGERALRREDCPMVGSDSGEQMDAFIYRHYPELIRQGLAHYQRALDHSERPWRRARALEELAHGQLLMGQPNVAIATLRRAFALSSDLPMASHYARVAFQRTAPSRGTLGAPSGEDQVSANSGDSSGYDTGMVAPGMPSGRMTTQSTRVGQTLRAADRLLRELEAAPQTPDGRERRQHTLNQLDELFPGAATGYDAATGNVTDVDLPRLRMMMNQLAQPEDETLASPGQMTPPGPAPGPGGPRMPMGVPGPGMFPR